MLSGYLSAHSTFFNILLNIYIELYILLFWKNNILIKFSTLHIFFAISRFHDITYPSRHRRLSFANPNFPFIPEPHLLTFENRKTLELNKKLSITPFSNDLRKTWIFLVSAPTMVVSQKSHQRPCHFLNLEKLTCT